MRHHGSAPGEPNSHLLRGDTARLDNLQAALLPLRLKRLTHENAQRRRAAEIYRELLGDLPLRLPPADAPHNVDVYHLFVVEAPERDRVMAALRKAGIGTAIHYPTPVHLQPAWKGLGYALGAFPVAESLAKTSLSLPIFPGIRESEQLRVAEAMRVALPVLVVAGAVICPATSYYVVQRPLLRFKDGLHPAPGRPSATPAGRAESVAPATGR